MKQLILEGTFWWETVGELDIVWKFLPGNRVISTCVYGPVHGTWKLDGKAVEINFEAQTHHKKSRYVGEIREYDNDRIRIEGYSFSFIYDDNSPIKSEWSMFQTNPEICTDWNWD